MNARRWDVRRSFSHKQNLPSALSHGEARASVSRSPDVKSELLQLEKRWCTVRLKLASKALGVLSNAELANRRYFVFSSQFLSFWMNVMTTVKRLLLYVSWTAALSFFPCLFWNYQWCLFWLFGRFAGTERVLLFIMFRCFGGNFILYLYLVGKPNAALSSS